MGRSLLAVLLAVGLVAIFPASALADDGETTCSGTLAPGTYKNVVVPEGAGCIVNGSTITGNFTASHAGDTVEILNSTVGGNVKIDHMSAHAVVRNGVNVLHSRISGNLKVTDNSPRWGFQVQLNTIGGNLIFSDNAPLEGVGRLSHNAVGGNLVANGNTFYGNVLFVGANTVTGNLTFNGNAGALTFGYFPGAAMFPNSAGGKMVCRDNIGFTTSGTNTARKVVGCN